MAISLINVKQLTKKSGPEKNSKWIAYWLGTSYYGLEEQVLVDFMKTILVLVLPEPII